MPYPIIFLAAAVCCLVIVLLIRKTMHGAYEKKVLESRLRENAEEIDFQKDFLARLQKTLDDSDALDFIREHGYEILDEVVLDELPESVQLPMPGERLKPYWQHACDIAEKVKQLDVNSITEYNSEGVPRILERDFQESFDYDLCRMLFAKNLRLTRYRDEEADLQHAGVGGRQGKYPNEPLKRDVSRDNIWYVEMKKNISLLEKRLEWLGKQHRSMLEHKNSLNRKCIPKLMAVLMSWGLI